MAKDRSGARLLWIAVGALVLGAALLWWSSTMAWDTGEWSAYLPTGAPPPESFGAGLARVLVPLAVVAAAAVGGVLATGGWARRVVGFLAFAAGVAVITLAVLGLIDAEEILTGPVVAGAGGLCVIAGGVVVVKHAGRLPRMGARYANPQAERSRGDSDDQLWKALSDGEDPTIEG